MCLDYIKLNEYFDKALEIQEKNLVEEHLMSCSKCRLALNNLIVINKTISILPKPVVGSYFVDKVIAKVSEVSHPSIEELTDYCDNNISGFAYSKISEHIEECDKCRDIINSINIETTPYFEQFEFKVSANFLDNIFAKIDIAESEGISDISTFEIKPVISSLVHISNIDISAYIDNELKNEELQTLENHLSECEVCEAKVKMFGLSRNTVMNLDKPLISLNFSKNVVKIIESEDKVISISRFMRRFIPAASMVAGLLIIGTFFGISGNIDDDSTVTQAVNITVRSEEFLFSPQSQTYKTDSINVLSDTSQDDSLLIEDIGL